MKDSTKRLARLAVLTALGTVLLFLASSLPTAKLSLAAIASFAVCLALMMYGPWWSAGVFALTAGLGLLLFPGSAALAYLLFLGYYPIAKSLAERLHSKAACWICKYVLYTAAFVGWFLLAGAVLADVGTSLPWYILYPVGAVVFGIYDWCYSLLIRLYIEKFARYFP